MYHKYTGHDNNRDWFMFTQKETRLVVEHIHNAWRPHITYDIHQTRADGMRMILPPLLDPIGPNVDPVIQSEMAALGALIWQPNWSPRVKAGVAMNMVYDSYSPSRSYPHYHGGLRVLSEAASAKIATPIDIPAAALRDDRGERPKAKVLEAPSSMERRGHGSSATSLITTFPLLWHVSTMPLTSGAGGSETAMTSSRERQSISPIHSHT